MVIYFYGEDFQKIFFRDHHKRSLLSFNEWWLARLAHYEALGLRPEPNNARMFKVIDPKRWMLTILKTGVKYSEITTQNHNS